MGNRRKRVTFSIMRICVLFIERFSLAMEQTYTSPISLYIPRELPDNLVISESVPMDEKGGRMKVTGLLRRQ